MKKYYILLVISLMIALDGCASLNSYMEKRIKEESGILEEENYVSYQNIVASGNVDDEGFYIQKSDESESMGTVHVTFATNSKLDIKYFEDPEKHIAINTSSYYLNYGFGGIWCRQNCKSKQRRYTGGKRKYKTFNFRFKVWR